MFLNKTLYTIQDKLFNLFIIISWILIIISALGFSHNTSKFVINLDYYVRIYICLFLIWRFNPFRQKFEFTDLDRKIAFNAGLIILTTTALNQYVINFKEKLRQIL